MNERLISNSNDTKKEKDEMSVEYETIGKKEKLALYSRSIAISVSQGLVGPFVSMIAIRNMNASGSDLGWLQSIANLLLTFLNPIFGRMSDILRKRIPFIVISTVSWGIPYIFLYWVKSPISIIIIVALVNLFGSLGVSSWGALQNELFPPKVRAKLSSKVFWYNAFGSMIATFFTGIVLTLVFGDIDYQKYILIPVVLGIALSAIGILPFIGIEEPLNRIKKEDQPVSRKLKESFSLSYQNKPFRKFVFFSMIYSFFWSFAWPLFPIKQVTILEASALEIAILNILFSVTTLLFINVGAKISDSVGRTKMIFFSRIMMATFPLLYIFASSVWQLYIIHFVVASLVTLGMPSVQAYLLDIAPEREGGIYFGIYNMITGLFLFFGSLFSGYLVDMLRKNSGLEIAITIGLGISFLGRFLTSFLFLFMKEQKTFPSSFGQIVQQLKLRRIRAP
ncbi:MAG: MFS transporter [Candidatus Heimdallarchaeum aukensis]|uniref:MFS transporter n=1 Tax=Candidatus Heimdallarchaeum aukensis TaxID=2876573 RepID=A0A9Y1FM98_9ARCH|nr:MAG: MFS transporter [Candidatus Heimdallarchaeum aukensis]